MSEDPVSANTYMDWALMGYRVVRNAQPVGKNAAGELLFSDKDVLLDDAWLEE